MNKELTEAFKTLSEYCKKHLSVDPDCRYGCTECELRSFCQQCINVPADFYTVYVEEEGL